MYNLIYSFEFTKWGSLLYNDRLVDDVHTPQRQNKSNVVQERGLSLSQMPLKVMTVVMTNY